MLEGLAEYASPALQADLSALLEELEGFEGHTPLEIWRSLADEENGAAPGLAEPLFSLAAVQTISTTQVVTYTYDAANRLTCTCGAGASVSTSGAWTIILRRALQSIP